jgi:hypothetical protein
MSRLAMGKETCSEPHFPGYDNKNSADARERKRQSDEIEFARCFWNDMRKPYRCSWERKPDIKGVGAAPRPIMPVSLRIDKNGKWVKLYSVGRTGNPVEKSQVQCMRSDKVRQEIEFPEHPSSRIL